MLKNNRPYTIGDGGVVDDSLVTTLADDDVAKVFEWIRNNIKPAEDVCERYTSYSIKHMLETDTGVYTTNNQFKDAMLLCGFKAEDVDELNWKFYIDRYSPAFIKNEEPLKERFQKLRSEMSMEGDWSQAKFADFFQIPLSTYRKWEQGVAEPPEYVFSMMDSISWYVDTLWKRGIPDDVLYDKDEYRRMAWEREHRFADRTDFRVYDETGDRDCRSIRMYMETWGALSGNKAVFGDMIGTFFRKYGVEPFVTADILLEAMEDIFKNDVYCLIFSVGPRCCNEIYGQDGISAVLYAYGNDGDYVDFYIKGQGAGNKFRCVVWGDDGERTDIPAL